jgi:DNA topoisomerase-1
MGGIAIFIRVGHIANTVIAWCNVFTNGRIVARCYDLPGETLFQYEDDDGALCSVESADVNEYLRRISGQDFTAKDFRTWAGTVLAAQALTELSTFESDAAAKRNIVAAVKSVSQRLGNTPAVCRKCYVHPQIFDAYLDGHLGEALEHGTGQADLSALEDAVLSLLRDRLAGPVSKAA